jgi:hypothetical protein
MRNTPIQIPKALQQPQQAEGTGIGAKNYLKVYSSFRISGGCFLWKHESHNRLYN